MKKLLIIVLIFLNQPLFSQIYSVTDKNIGLVGYTHGLTIQSVGLYYDNGDRVTDLKKLKFEQKLKLVFTGIGNTTILDGISELVITTSIIDVMDNKMILVEKILDLELTKEELETGYLSSDFTLASSLTKGKTYTIKALLYDINSGYYAELIWTFKANFKS